MQEGVPKSLRDTQSDGDLEVLMKRMGEQNVRKRKMETPSKSLKEPLMEKRIGEENCPEVN